MTMADEQSDVLNDDSGIDLDLKNPFVAALLAWIVPGLGHFYQGRTAKAITIFVAVTMLFISGYQMGGGKVVYCSFTSEDLRWQFVGQFFLGAAAVPAVIQNRSLRSQQQLSANVNLLWNGFLAPPTSTRELNKWNREYHSFFQMGTLYTLVAGLLNLFAIYDAYGGPGVWHDPVQRKKRLAAVAEAADEEVS
jgi:hypothetical protein